MDIAQATRRIWGHPLFAAGVALLLLNDLLFKAAFHNAVTGKLSDIAGLFVFPAFWCVFRMRYAALVYALAGAFFVWWKLPVSGPAIDALNYYAGIHVRRIIDPTDLWALLVLPFSYALFIKQPARQLLTALLSYISGAAGFFAFCATSQAPRYLNGSHIHTGWPENKIFHVRGTPENVLAALDSAHIRTTIDSVTYRHVDMPKQHEMYRWPGYFADSQEQGDGNYSISADAPATFVTGGPGDVYAHRGESLTLQPEKELYIRTAHKNRYRVFAIPVRKTKQDTIQAMQITLRAQGGMTEVQVSAIWLANDQIAARSEARQKRISRRYARRAVKRLRIIIFRQNAQGD